MKFTVERNQLIKPLQQVSSMLNSRPALPILGNLLVKVQNNMLSITSTDLEIEIVSSLVLKDSFEEGSTTIPSRKFLDICRGLSQTSVLSIILQGDRLNIHSGRSKFSFSTLPANDFPNIEAWKSEIEVSLTQAELRGLVEKTKFSMANQDVRYYLNGMLFEIDGSVLRTIATDGHRMAVSQIQLMDNFKRKQIIVPRKGVHELVKLLTVPEKPVVLQIGSSNLRIEVNDFVFTSKLIDGLFPDYRRVFPKNTNKTLEASCNDLHQAFSRVAIFSSEKFRCVRIKLVDTEMRIVANNSDREEAEEILDISFNGYPLEMGFNVSYMLDILSTLRCDKILMFISDANSSVLIRDFEDDSTMYVLMPIRL
ncbi:DNA polymerase III subunit beta [Candidatus Photodesmus blepharus]|uniref:Beta sliding clamp n=1 Tax=Candidatus Photodesmus blepharonis TaxID=1179155 RepID=A0A084CNT1_9GAMM|nr:DNA polymerase III subunit beta [Candidatus Photodesmus blepharus]KEY91460.1 DNA polymerase III subunit beta [Candidatus Photodesmus blepharus]